MLKNSLIALIWLFIVLLSMTRKENYCVQLNTIELIRWSIDTMGAIFLQDLPVFILLFSATAGP